jgi:lipopolysaccharide assembly protein A
MRFVYFLFLLLILAAIAVFVVQNNENVNLTYLQWSVTLPMAVVVGAAYVLGMLSGWTVVGFMKRSFEQVTARTDR